MTPLNRSFSISVFFAHNSQFITLYWYAINMRKLFLEKILARFTTQIPPFDCRYPTIWCQKVSMSLAIL